MSQGRAGGRRIAAQTGLGRGLNLCRHRMAARHIGRQRVVSIAGVQPGRLLVAAHGLFKPPGHKKLAGGKEELGRPPPVGVAHGGLGWRGLLGLPGVRNWSARNWSARNWIIGVRNCRGSQPWGGVLRRGDYLCRPALHNLALRNLTRRGSFRRLGLREAGKNQQQRGRPEIRPSPERPLPERVARTLAHGHFEGLWGGLHCFEKRCQPWRKPTRTAL